MKRCEGQINRKKGVMIRQMRRCKKDKRSIREIIDSVNEQQRIRRNRQ